MKFLLSCLLWIPCCALAADRPAAPNILFVVADQWRAQAFGFAGDPNGMDIAPLVTVELSGVRFRPLVLFNTAGFVLPPFRTTLTAEDSSGSQSN